MTSLLRAVGPNRTFRLPRASLFAPAVRRVVGSAFAFDGPAGSRWLSRRRRTTT